MLALRQLWRFPGSATTHAADVFMLSKSPTSTNQAGKALLYLHVAVLFRDALHKLMHTEGTPAAISRSQTVSACLTRSLTRPRSPGGICTCPPLHPGPQPFGMLGMSLPNIPTSSMNMDMKARISSTSS